MFNVTAGQTVSVQVPLACHEAPRTGSVVVNGTLNICPTIDGISAMLSPATSLGTAKRLTPSSIVIP